MKFKIGDKVIVRAEAEEMQNALFQEIDGASATVSEVYRNSYEPNVFRIEVELDQPVNVNGEMIRTVPGLYMDNIERVNRTNESRSHKGWFSGLAVNRFSSWSRIQEKRAQSLK